MFHSKFVRCTVAVSVQDHQQRMFYIQISGWSPTKNHLPEKKINQLNYIK